MDDSSASPLLCYSAKPTAKVEGSARIEAPMDARTVRESEKGLDGPMTSRHAPTEARELFNERAHTGYR